MWNAAGLLRLRLFVACLLGVGLCAACGASPAPPTRDVIVWQRLGSWSGHGLLQTNPFENDSGMLRVEWQTRSDGTAKDGLLRVFLHSAVSGRRLTAAVDHRGAGSGTAYINEDPRGFYLVIESAGLGWTVEVAEGIPARRVAERQTR